MHTNEKDREERGMLPCRTNNLTRTQQTAKAIASAAESASGVSVPQLSRDCTQLLALPPRRGELELAGNLLLP